MKAKQFGFGLSTIAVFSVIPLSVLTISQPTYANSFNLIGDWSGSPDCPLIIYEDDGKNIKGNCDNGSYSHVINGSYASENKISVIVTRKDPNNCKTSVRGFIQVIDKNHLKYSQEGWNGCGVRTKPAKRDLSRVN